MGQPPFAKYGRVTRRMETVWNMESREEICLRLKKAFSKVAYLNSRSMDAEDFEQAMWVELLSWIDKHGVRGVIPNGKHEGKVLLDQTPIFIAYRMAGRAAKNQWHINRRRNRELSFEDINLGTGKRGQFEGNQSREETFAPNPHNVHSRHESLRTLVLWAYRERGELTPSTQKAIEKLYRDGKGHFTLSSSDQPTNYHINLEDSHELAICKRFAALTGAEALDVLILLESKDGRHYDAMRCVLECGGVKYTELQEMGISCKFFTKSKKQLSTLYSEGKPTK
jgi:hypothetical protein